MATAVQQRICLTCLTRAFHLPVNCRGLKMNHLICQHKACDKNREYHHNSICDKSDYTTNPQSMSKIPLVEDNQEE